MSEHLTHTPVRDAKLTPLGRLQAKHLNALTASTFQTTAELLVCSIQRRPMNTARLGYPSLHSRLAKAGKPPIVLDILQEVDDAPSDTPTYPPDDIRKDPDFTEYLKDVDLQGLDPMYATKEGVFHPDRVGERAEMVRRWLYDRPEREIVGMSDL
jgi:broad specificity phosphatase PhoE